MSYEVSNGNEMNCAMFKSRLNALLDARRLPQLDIQLCTHTRHCPQCDHWLSTQMRLLDAVPSAPVELPADFAVRVLEQVATERREQRHWQVRATAFIAAAAAVLIAVTCWHKPAVTPGLAVVPSGYQPTQLTAAVLQRVDKVAADFKPVTGSVYTAFNAFWLANRLL